MAQRKSVRFPCLKGAGREFCNVSVGIAVVVQSHLFALTCSGITQCLVSVDIDGGHYGSIQERCHVAHRFTPAV